MPTNYYAGQTETELKAKLAALQARSSTGSVSMTSTFGNQTMRSWQGAARPEVEIKRVLYALFRLDPERYDNPYVDRVRQASASYQ